MAILQPVSSATADVRPFAFVACFNPDDRKCPGYSNTPATGQHPLCSRWQNSSSSPYPLLQELHWSPTGLEHLTGELHYFQSQAIAKSSRKTYHQGQLSYISFCTSFNLRPYPLVESSVHLFATYLARSVSYTTICTYLSSIRLQNIELGFRPTPEMPLLRLLLKGIKRAKGERTKPKRKPISLSLLKTLKSALRFSPFITYDQKMLWAAFTTVFFGFLRASEFCPHVNHFSILTRLSWFAMLHYYPRSQS